MRNKTGLRVFPRRQDNELRCHEMRVYKLRCLDAIYEMEYANTANNTILRQKQMDHNKIRNMKKHEMSARIKKKYITIFY